MNHREIDRLVAEKVMRYKFSQGDILEGTKRFGLPNYSTRIEDAFEVVEKLRRARIFNLHDAWDEENNKIYKANFQYDDGFLVINHEAYAKTASLAISLASLKSLGIEVN